MADSLSATCVAMDAGLACRNRPVDGDNRCAAHGGRVGREVRRQSRIRAQALVDPAIATVARLMATAKSESVKLRAAMVALDLAGMLNHGSPTEAEDQLDLLTRRLRLMNAAARRAAEQGEDGTVDAEVIDPRPDRAVVHRAELRAVAKQYGIRP